MRRPGRLVLLFVVVVVVGCNGDNSGDVIIDLKTDLRSGLEFDSVLIELAPASSRSPLRIELLVTPRLDFLGGLRIAEFPSVPEGAYSLRVALNAADVGVAQSIIPINVQGTVGVEVLITRDCADVRCPAITGDAADTACLAGRCVDPGCAVGGGTDCPSNCASDPDCTSTDPCQVGRCSDSVCLFAYGDSGCMVPNDAGLDAPLDALPDVGIDTGPPCACAVPGDVCVMGAEETVCVKEGFSCASAPCPADYRCLSDATCACDDPNVCGIFCTSDVECDDDRFGTPSVCDAATNRCRPRHLCLSDLGCASTDYCDVGSGGNVCKPRGTREVGATCSTDEDCVSVRCVFTLCRESCTASSECPTGSECQSDRSDSSCLPPDPRCASCGTEQACRLSGSASCVDRCITTNDCASGSNCSMTGVGIEAGRCEAGTRCSGDEFAWGSVCVRATQTCWTDAPNCPPEYTCQILGTLNKQLGTQGRALGVCGR